MSDVLKIEKLNREHILDGFDCSQDDLNRWLPGYAQQNQSANSSQTCVGVFGKAVVGFYSLSAGQVDYADAPERLRKGLARHLLPVVLLARLAVDNAWRGKRLGPGLLRDAVTRTIQAADIVGIRAMAVHAKDDYASAYYQQFDFAPSPTDPWHLFALLDLRKSLGE